MRANSIMIYERELGTAQPQLVSILVVMAIVAVLNILGVITITSWG